MKNFIHNNILYKLGWVNYLIDTKETSKDFLIDTLEENPIQTLTDLIFQSERLNHQILRAEKGTSEDANDFLSIGIWQTELTEFIFNIEILTSEFKISKEDVKSCEAKAESMLNMWILKKFTEFRWATKEMTIE